MCRQNVMGRARRNAAARLGAKAGVLPQPSFGFWPTAHLARFGITDREAPLCNAFGLSSEGTVAELPQCRQIRSRFTFARLSAASNGDGA